VGTHLRQIAVLLALAVAVRAEIIDRVAVSVGNRVITTSDLDRQLRVAAFQDGVKPDFSPAARSAAAEAAHPGVPVGLDDFRRQIEQTLTGQRADKQMDTWLKEARKRAEIVYHEEVFR